ncbi:hypothetical protein Poli38472_000328 [Pythium oligandrum]|uniref:FYVE-type domain-containing protein n=1 Tax=Pythium oligandrum TaxID=41045 RepID=A0A8K1FF86_PYTOL|nr:hypothetical protein Poli38472_000328 [Pythium oligandrum]|eukprot:TMW60286.1 hypothetical protein Poli38472_000328 [Pythium oligandrum]
MVKDIFPLPEDYFPQLELNPQEEHAFQAWGDSMLQQTINAYHQDQFLTVDQRERRWKALKQRGDLTAYRRRKGYDGPDEEYRYLCKGRIDGTVDEVMFGRYADTTDMFRRISAVYREDLVDCAVLHVMKSQSPSNPYQFSGFKWMTVKSPGKGIVKNRDVCWYEQTGLTKDHNGKEIGYSVVESVDIPSCPLFDSQYCVRARFSVCYLFRPNKSGGTKVFMRGKNDAGGKVMDWVADLKSAELWLRVDRAMVCAHAYSGTQMVLAALPSDPAELIGKNNRCEVCHDKTSGMMHSQKECSVCRRVTCSRCVVKRRVLSSGRDFLEPERAHFCKRCMRFLHDINYRNPESIARVCTAAAGRRETMTPSDLPKHSYSSDESSDYNGSLDQTWLHTPASSTQSRNRVSRPDTSSLSAGSNSCPNVPPVMLYTEPVTKSKRIQSKSVDYEAPPRSARAMPPRMVSVSSQSSFTSETSFADSSDGGEGNRDTGDSSSSKGSYSAPIYEDATPRLPKTYSTPEDMMAQMIRMNIMAEQARQIVKENDKFARQFSAA